MIQNSRIFSRISTWQNIIDILGIPNLLEYFQPTIIYKYYPTNQKNEGTVEFKKNISTK